MVLESQGAAQSFGGGKKRKKEEKMYWKKNFLATMAAFIMAIGLGQTVTLNAASVSLGSDHSSALAKDGSLYLWGYNYSGEVGDGSKTDRATPVKVLGNVASVSLGDCQYGFTAESGVYFLEGGISTSALTKSGDLYMWGFNLNSELGDGTKTNRTKPVKILSRVASVSVGYDHNGAIAKDGSLYLWGRNTYGQVGNGTKTDQPKPTKVLNNVASVSLGYDHSGAVTRGGSLYLWGRNDFGQLGDGTHTDRTKPVKVLDNVVSASLGAWHSSAITEDGSLYLWGRNDFGQLGDGTKKSRPKPVKVLGNMASVRLGMEYSSAISRNGNLYLWGHNDFGRLGDGTKKNRSKPVKVLSNVASVQLGGWHNGALAKDGSLYLWGANYDGQLGDGTHTDRTKPVKVLSNVASFSLGGDHSSAVTKNGILYMWGSNYCGQVGDGTRAAYRSKPVKVLSNVAPFSLSKKSQTITYKAAQIKNKKIPHGAKFSLSAKASGGGKLSYKSSKSSVLSVDQEGNVSAKGYGDVTITIKAAATSNYRAASKKIKVAVVPAQAKMTEGKWLVAGEKAYFEWKADKSASGYQIDFAYDSTFSKSSKKDLKKNYMTISDFSIGSAKVYIRVRAYKKIGQKKYYGAWSDAWYFKT